MLDPRIYRTGLVVVVFAVMVLAFSLGNQQGPLGTNLAPDAFNAQNVYSTMTSLASQYPDRRPGSASDDDIAAYIAQKLQADGIAPSSTAFSGRTVDGTRTLETVTGTLAGKTSGSIVIVAHRDALRPPATAELSGTAVLLELARVLSGETRSHTIVFASTSGSVGAVGAAELARSLPPPVDAVIVLGDLVGSRVHNPIVVPWSNGLPLAPTVLRNTIAAAVASQTNLRVGGTSLASEIAHLAFPMTVSEQGPFGVYGQPAVLLSVSGERGPSANELPAPAQITAAQAQQAQAQLNGLGRAALQSVGALDAGSAIPAPSVYALFAGKVIPDWAVRLFVLALIIPVLISTIDGVARARRRGHSIMRWLIWVLASASPFALGLLLLLGARLVGLLAIAPPGPLAAGAVPLDGSGFAVLVADAVVIVLAFLVLRPFVIALTGREVRAARRSPDGLGSGAGAAVLIVMIATTLAIWVKNPYAAGLMVLALHLWMWIVDPDVRVPAPVTVLLLLLGLGPPVLVVVYYAISLGLSPLGVAWNGALLFAGGHLGLLAGLEWSVALGCLASVVVIALRGTGEDLAEQVPITVRGPISYAGPGSLGGTKSALRR